MDVFRNSCGSFLDQSEFETSSVCSSFIRNVFGSFGFSWLDFHRYLESFSFSEHRPVIEASDVLDLF